MSVVSPSGEQFEIAFEEQRAVVVEVGAGLRAYSVNGLHVLNGYGSDEMATGGRGQVLIPWPNRIKDGSYEFGGSRHQLPLNEAEHSNAIHGLVRWSAWRLRAHDPRRVALEYVVHPQPGYPFSLQVSVDYALSSAGLTVRTTATNVGASPCPYGCGAHPYLTVGGATVDDVVLRVPARNALRSDERGIPVGTSPVDGAELDFRTPRRIGGARLDNGFTDLDRDDSGVARVELRSGDSRARVTLWLDHAYPYVMVFTGDIPAVRRRGLAVEPMTCPPNAFRSGESVVVLEQGDSHVATWGIAAEVKD